MEYMKSQFYRMSAEEIQKEIGLSTMSITPRKYHGPELKCSGPGLCQDCTERQKLGIPFETDLSSLKEEKKETVCVCTARELWWHGCRCKNDGTEKKLSIKF